MGILVALSVAGVTPPPSPSPGATPLPTIPAAADPLGFWDRFFTSAGFAGVLAVVAAGIAAWAAWRQMRQTSNQHKSTQFWDTLKWVFDRSAGSKSDGPSPLPDVVALAMLDALRTDAERRKEDEPLQGESVAAIIGMFRLPDEGKTESSVSQGAPTDERVVVNPAAEELLVVLRNEISDAPSEQARRFEQEVGSRLTHLFAEGAVQRMSQGSCDFVVRLAPGKRVGVEVEWARRPVPASLAASWAQRAIQWMRDSDLAGGVVICNQPLSPGGLHEWRRFAPPKALYFEWNEASLPTLLDVVEAAASIRP